MPPKVLEEIKAKEEQKRLEEEKKQKWREVWKFISSECSNWSANGCDEFISDIQELLLNSNKAYREFYEQI